MFNFGVIDFDSVDKVVCFMCLCDVYGLLIFILIDIFGIMVGLVVEKIVLVCYFVCLFLIVVLLYVFLFVIVLCKVYGLGVMVVVGGYFKVFFFIVVWFIGEFGGMGLEGGVCLVYKKEMDVIEDLD